MTGGQLLVDCLIRQGVQHAFGMPGGHLDYVYDGLYQRREQLHHVLVRNEQSASFMAVGYARSTGQVGVCLTIPGPGAANALSGMAEAAAGCDPVLLVTSQAETQWTEVDRRRIFHGMDHASVFKSIAKWAGRAETADGLPELVANAFCHLRSGRPGPVVIEVPKDVLSAQTDAAPAERVDPEPAAPDPDAVREAAAVLGNSQRPAIIAGECVLYENAFRELENFAAALGAPVLATHGGKGAISEDSPWFGADLRSPAGRAIAKEADCSVLVGCRLGQTETMGWQLELPQPRIGIDADPAELDSPYTFDLRVVGSVRLSLRRVTAAMGHHGAGGAWFPRGRESEPPSPLLAGIRDVLDEDGILVAGVTMEAYGARREFKVTRPRTFMFSGTYVALGFAVPAALGAKVGNPKRQVAALCGDGGFMFGCQELATAMQFDIPVVFVVVNDHCLTSIKGEQKRLFGARYIAVDLRNPNFAKLADAFGVPAYRIGESDDVRPVLSEALSAGKPALIEVRKNSS